MGVTVRDHLERCALGQWDALNREVGRLRAELAAAREALSGWSQRERFNPEIIEEAVGPVSVSADEEWVVIIGAKELAAAARGDETR